MVAVQGRGRKLRDGGESEPWKFVHSERAGKLDLREACDIAQSAREKSEAAQAEYWENEVERGSEE